MFFSCSIECRSVGLAEPFCGPRAAQQRVSVFHVFSGMMYLNDELREFVIYLVLTRVRIAIAARSLWLVCRKSVIADSALSSQVVADSAVKVITGL